MSHLTYKCSRMLTTGTFLDRLKFSEILPIHKKGVKTLISNYRPNSLMPVFFQKFFKKLYSKAYTNM
jgi:hypothetical protein